MEIRELFLEAMKAALENRTINCNQAVSRDEWSKLFELSSQQNVMPMVYQSVCKSEVFQDTGGFLQPILKRKVIQLVTRQVMQTQEFLALYRKLQENDLEPVVAKGIVIRNLMPYPDNRISCDEDILIPTELYEKYKQVLVLADMELAEWDSEIETVSHEVSYNHRGGVLRIEVHKELFDAESSAYKGMNELFADAFENSIVIEIEGVQIRTFNFEDHLLFLILHALKHFVSSGFGIRQVCDMVVFGNCYGEKTDWNYVLEKSKLFNADVFAAALFDIGHRYLGFDWKKAHYPQNWREIKVDSENMLKDLLDAGVFGTAEMSRKHSSNMTLSAVSAQNEGKRIKSSLLKTVFPPACILQSRYPWLQEKQFLLPIAWTDRILKYCKETVRGGKDNKASESVRIGRQRLELMKQYGILRDFDSK